MAPRFDLVRKAARIRANKKLAEESYLESKPQLEDDRESHATETKHEPRAGDPAALGDILPWLGSSSGPTTAPNPSESSVLMDVTLIERSSMENGNFAKIYQGRRSGQLVALKQLKVTHTTPEGKVFRRFTEEAEKWRRLQDDNVLPFLGIYSNTAQENIYMVSPWCENGNLPSYLERNAKVDRFELLLDIVRGLAYLHTYKPAVVHGDLRGINILISDDGKARLTNYGLSTLLDDALDLEPLTSLDEAGARWMAPERLDPGFLGTNIETDIWALGMTVVELYTGSSPFPEDASDSQILQDIQRCDLPPQPKTLDPKILDLANTCWVVDPKLRPSVTHILSTLGQEKME